MENEDRQPTLEYLTKRIDYERAPARGAREFKLDRMRRIMRELGDPQCDLRVVHVAGTKGKGSTASMIASILRAAGLHTGLYTSPHLQHLKERYNVAGAPCSPEQLVTLVDLVRPVIDRIDAEAISAGEPAHRATYFEVTTAMAFLHFARCAVDAVVLEVGLGGRLDSTNVCQPQAAVITSISFDHTRQLGATLAEICREKAGIIKPHADVVTGVKQPVLQAIIAGVAAEHDCRLWRIGREFDYEYRSLMATEAAADLAAEERRMATALDYWDFEVGNQRKPAPTQLNDLRLRLAGRHQAANAAVAVATVRCLQDRGWAINDDDIRRGLAQAACPARAEIVARRPTVLLDVAHNVASIEALIEVINEQFGGRRRVLVFASSRDKDVSGMLRRLLPHFDRVVLTRFCDNPRACSPSDLAEICRSQQLGGVAAIDIAENPAEAWRRSLEIAGADDLICAAGSFFLAAEIRPFAVARESAARLTSLSAV